jgi:ABC-type antimicrobial peptide transport system permease subunit
LRYALRYALRHLGREQQRAAFVIFCVAIGVATVVALRTLGLIVQDALLRDLQASNRGDLAIDLPAEIDDHDQVKLLDGRRVTVDRSLFELSRDESFWQLSPRGAARLQRWVDSQGGELQLSWSNAGPFTGFRPAGQAANAEYVLVKCVDPARYPFYGQVFITTPAGASLAQLLRGPQDIIISDELAAKSALQPGDQVTLSGAGQTYTVRGVVNPKSEASLSDPVSAVFPFVYLALATCPEDFQGAATYTVRLPAGAAVAAAEQDLEATFPGLEITTTADVGRSNRQFSDIFTRLMTVMGLVSLLIGGIGIANTMLVAVSRRSLEIAVLKTLGVPGGQIVLLFLAEAALVGLAGSLLGLGLGLGLVALLQGVAERFVAQKLALGIYPEALLSGLALGLTVTLVFSLLPVLAAGKVRPNRVLHPEAAARPQLGAGLSLAVTLGLAAVLGVIVGLIVGYLLIGIGLALAVLAALGLLTWLLRWLIVLVCRLPSLGNASLKLAQRALSGQRERAASTLLALTVGIFTLSLVWVLVEGTLQVVNTKAEQYLGGNVLVTVLNLEAADALEHKLDRLDGVTYIHDSVYQAEIVAINGDRNMEAFRAAAEAHVRQANLLGDTGQTIDNFIEALTLKVQEDDTWDYQIAAGRDFTPGGRDELLIEASFYDGVQAWEWFDLQPGDTLTLRFPSGAQRTAAIVGTTRPHNAGFLLGGLVALRETDAIASPGFAPRTERPEPALYVLTVDPARMSQVLDELDNIEGVFMVETQRFSSYTERFGGQFVPLPLIVAGLALFASAVIIANTVTLAVLERRTQIGIMKAIGLQTEHVLGLLLLENGLVGLLGGLLGPLLSTLIVAGSGALGEAWASSLPLGALALLAALAVGLALGATLLAAWGAVRERPLHILRYE